MPGVYGSIKKLVTLLGLPGALKLAAALGGTTIYVPSPGHLRNGHILVEVLGLDGARKLAAEWPQLEVTVPRCAEQLRRMRDREIRANREHMTAGEAARKYQLTDRMIYVIWASQGDGGRIPQG